MKGRAKIITIFCIMSLIGMKVFVLAGLAGRGVLQVEGSSLRERPVDLQW